MYTYRERGKGSGVRLQLPQTLLTTIFTRTLSSGNYRIKIATKPQWLHRPNNVSIGSRLSGGMGTLV